jgi:hypothetical protein
MVRGVYIQRGPAERMTVAAALQGRAQSHAIEILVPWLLEASDFTDRRLPNVPDCPAGIHSRKAVNASVLGIAIAIQE